jgi:tetratricopeptide (TPR) repeat protein
MSLAGSLKTMHVVDLLQWCGTNLKTGTLRLTRGPIEKRLFFKDGQPFSSTSNSPRETLGQFLIRAGKLNEEELFKALIQQDRSQEPLGQILIRQGLLTDEELNELLRLKTGESIYDCFLWPDGDFVFEDDRLPEEISVYIPLDLTAVILEGARRSDEWNRISQVFPSRFTTFTVEPDDGAELSEEDQKILELVSQGKNLGEIALELHAVDFYAATRLHELHERGLISVAVAMEEIPFEQQMADLQDKLREGVVCFNAGQHSEALAAFEAALAIDPQNKYARLFVLKIQREMEDAKGVNEIPLDGVPVLCVSMEELAKLELDPHEGFVLSRVNGEWNVRSILKICPMREDEVLIIFKRLIDIALIEFQ